MKDQSDLILPRHIKDKLADPSVHIVGNIKIFLGTEVFFSILEGKRWAISTNASLYSTHYSSRVIAYCQQIIYHIVQLYHFLQAKFLSKSLKKLKPNNITKQHPGTTF